MQRLKLTFLKRAASNNPDHKTFSFECNHSFERFSSLSVFPKCFVFFSIWTLGTFLRWQLSHFVAAVYTKQTSDTMNNALQKTKSKRRKWGSERNLWTFRLTRINLATSLIDNISCNWSLRCKCIIIGPGCILSAGWARAFPPTFF